MTDTKKTLLVLGGTSDIGRATALIYAEHGWAVALAGRDEEALGREAADIGMRTAAPVSVHRFDVLDTASFAAFVDGLPTLPHAVISVIGLLGDQTRAQSDTDFATAIMRTNYEGPMLILGLFAQRFCARGSGTIIGVSSVAGDRGRASNYVYGSAKAGFTAFLSGLRQRCHKHGVVVITVKPGFVRTRMTEGMSLPGPLVARPGQVATGIWKAASKRKPVIYVLSIWRVIMLVIQHLPNVLFNRITL